MHRLIGIARISVWDLHCPRMQAAHATTKDDTHMSWQAESIGMHSPQLGRLMGMSSCGVAGNLDLQSDG